MDRQKNRAERPQSSEDKKEDEEKKKKIKKKKMDTGEQHQGEGGQGQGSSSHKQQSASGTQQEKEKHDLPPMYLDIDDMIITRTSDGEDSDELCSIKSDSPRDATPPRKIPPADRRS